MRKRTPTINRKKRTNGRGGRWKYVFITVFCAVLVMAGFFLVAVQHFATVELGIKNSELRSKVEELEAEKRRLLLARETTLSPAEIARTARRLGFVQRELAEPTIEIAATTASAKPETLATNKPVETAVERIVYSKPAAEDPKAGERERKAVTAPKAESKPRIVVAAVEKKPVDVLAAKSEGRPRRVSESSTKSTLATAARLK